jgi:hypothetical protein
MLYTFVKGGEESRHKIRCVVVRAQLKLRLESPDHIEGFASFQHPMLRMDTLRVSDILVLSLRVFVFKAIRASL